MMFLRRLLDGEKYLTAKVDYKAEITTPHDETTQEYIGTTSTEFIKVRYRNHKMSVNKHTYCSLIFSKYMWDLKDKKREYSIKWSILKRAAACVPGGRRCNLCIEEKLEIMKSIKTNLLNKRSKFFAKCRHREKFSAGKFERAQANKTPRQRTVDGAIT